MQFKNNTKQRFKTIQGLRSFKDTLPKNIKKIIMDKMNSFFGYAVVEKLKFISFDNIQTKFKKLDANENHVTNIKYADRINSIKNDKIKKSLLELTKLFKQR